MRLFPAVCRYTIEVVGDQATLLLSFVPGGVERFLVPRDGEQPDPAAFGLTFPWMVDSTDVRDNKEPGLYIDVVSGEAAIRVRR